jgi:hypothetical protein
MSLVEIHLPQPLWFFRFNVLQGFLDYEFYSRYGQHVQLRFFVAVWRTAILLSVEPRE